jgi:hypothetical protein
LPPSWGLLARNDLACLPNQALFAALTEPRRSRERMPGRLLRVTMRAAAAATRNSTSPRWASKSSTGRNCCRCSLHGETRDRRSSTARHFTSSVAHSLECRGLILSSHKLERCCRTGAANSMAGSNDNMENVRDNGATSGARYSNATDRQKLGFGWPKPCIRTASLRTDVSVSGKRNFMRRDKGDETSGEVHRDSPAETKLTPISRPIGR